MRGTRWRGAIGAALRATVLPDAREVYLRRLRHEGDLCFIHINKCGGTSVERALQIPQIHDTAAQRRRRLGAQRWNDLLTFTVVRHPYGKVRSHYGYRVRTAQTGMGDAHISLDDWVVAAYGDRDPTYYDKPLMFAPCTEWVTDSAGDVIIDRVLRFETLHADWARLMAETGRDLALGHHNARGLPVEPLGRKARRVIDQRFASDFDLFGYEVE
jgi:hypothetical protein